ncbi:hypothetical protein F5Y17DRAFT_446919 [Xylariaceae sp. FL0594]|nr:hypothetical protein F5Y17DRAFT_446919 [Xylariaceae sp. FL0594]
MRSRRVAGIRRRVALAVVLVLELVDVVVLVPDHRIVAPARDGEVARGDGARDVEVGILFVVVIGAGGGVVPSSFFSFCCCLVLLRIRIVVYAYVRLHITRICIIR